MMTLTANRPKAESQPESEPAQPRIETRQLTLDGGGWRNEVTEFYPDSNRTRKSGYINYLNKNIRLGALSIEYDFDSQRPTKRTEVMYGASATSKTVITDVYNPKTGRRLERITRQYLGPRLIKTIEKYDPKTGRADVELERKYERNSDNKWILNRSSTKKYSYHRETELIPGSGLETAKKLGQRLNGYSSVKASPQPKKPILVSSIAN